MEPCSAGTAQVFVKGVLDQSMCESEPFWRTVHLSYEHRRACSFKYVKNDVL